MMIAGNQVGFFVVVEFYVQDPEQSDLNKVVEGH